LSQNSKDYNQVR